MSQRLATGLRESYRGHRCLVGGLLDPGRRGRRRLRHRRAGDDDVDASSAPANRTSIRSASTATPSGSPARRPPRGDRPAPRPRSAAPSVRSSPAVGPPRMPSSLPAVWKDPAMVVRYAASVSTREGAVSRYVPALFRPMRRVTRARIRPPFPSEDLRGEASSSLAPGRTLALRERSVARQAGCTVRSRFMNTPPRRLATSLGLTAVLTVIGAVITIDRVPGGGALHAQQTSRKAGARCLKCCARPSRLR